MQALFITIDERGDIFLDPDQPAIRDPNHIEEIHRNLRLGEDFTLITDFQEEEYLVPE